MKKRICMWALVIALLLPVLSLPAFADVGPKPSVVVDFKGLEGESYYVTLLSDTESTGPWSTDKTYHAGYASEEIWNKFRSYSDADGFHFIGYLEDCSDTDSFSWSYFPPGEFKILIYFPEYDRFVASADSYERYAFDSYYTADTNDLDILSVTESTELDVRRTYDFTWELVSLLCRILVTIAVELGLALLFGLRAKKQIRLIVLTNIATQTVLNILLNIINYRYGLLAFIFNYVWMEIAVFIIEGLVYRKRLSRFDTRPDRKIHPWLYALAANILSFAVGLLIVRWLPGIF